MSNCGEYKFVSYVAIATIAKKHGDPQFLLSYKFSIDIRNFFNSFEKIL